MPPLYTRRRFLQRAAAGGLASLVLPAASHAAVSARDAVRVRGRVRLGGRGLEGVRVTDGVSVVRTDASGRYELVADARQPYVYASPPAGARVPVDAHGSALHYRPLAPGRGSEMDASFDFQPAEGDDETHAFLVLADPQTQNREETGMLHAETVPDVQATVRALGDTPVFGVGCGDLMWDNLELYPEYERAVAAMGVPFFQVVGNHDLDFGPTEGGSTRTFMKRFGPNYYSFDRGSVHYVVLDDVFWHANGYIGYLDDVQLRWLEADLATLEAGRTVVVFLHIPVLGTQYRRAGGTTPSNGTSVTNRDALFAVLEPYAAHIVAGHTHEIEHGRVGGVAQHVCGAVCGAWWSGPICHDGAPGGYAVFDVRGEELRWRYKATGRPDDYQLRVHPRGSDPDAPDEIVANVWDAGEGWEVWWYEDGERRGRMAQRVGYAPLSVDLHKGPEKPARRPWVEPVPTAHLFYAPANPSAREVRVEAVDPWGRTYTAVLDGGA